MAPETRLGDNWMRTLLFLSNRDRSVADYRPWHEPVATLHGWIVRMLLTRSSAFHQAP